LSSLVPVQDVDCFDAVAGHDVLGDFDRLIIGPRCAYPDDF
jgi:hypothetical protein